MTANVIARPAALALPAIARRRADRSTRRGAAATRTTWSICASVALHGAAVVALAAWWAAPPLPQHVPVLRATLLPAAHDGGDRPAASAATDTHRPTPTLPAPSTMPPTAVASVASRDGGRTGVDRARAAAAGVARHAPAPSDRSVSADPAATDVEAGPTPIPLSAGAGAFVLPTEATLTYASGDRQWHMQVRIRFDAGAYAVDVDLTDATGRARTSEHGSGMLRDYGFLPLAYRRSGADGGVAVVYDWAAGQARDADGRALHPLVPGLQDRASRLLQAAVQMQAVAGALDRAAVFAWRIYDGRATAARATLAPPAAAGAEAAGEARSWTVCQRGAGPDDADCMSLDAGGYFLPRHWQRTIDGQPIDFALVEVDGTPLGAPASTAPLAATGDAPRVAPLVAPLLARPAASIAR